VEGDERLAQLLTSDNLEMMTAAEIVREIERLRSEEKAEVLRALLRSQKNGSKLSPDELIALADQMIAAKDPKEADRLEAKILAGFYGK
jgi:hypothetical protein